MNANNCSVCTCTRLHGGDADCMALEVQMDDKQVTTGPNSITYCWVHVPAFNVPYRCYWGHGYMCIMYYYYLVVEVG